MALSSIPSAFSLKRFFRPPSSAFTLRVINTVLTWRHAVMNINAPNQARFTPSLKTRIISLGGAIALAWVGLVAIPAEAQNPPDFSGTGRSGNRVGGASRRGGCPAPMAPMTPLVPIDADYGGKTTQAQPTFWVYIPYALDEDSPVTFAIHDEDGSDLYQTTFITTAVAGVYGFELPPSVELAVDTYYDWYVLVYCNDPLREDVPAFASGWVQRVALPDGLEAERLDALSPTEVSDAFANQLIWYDALTPLGDALRDSQDPATLQAAWSELLELPSVKLGEFAEFPVTSCCSDDTVLTESSP